MWSERVLSRHLYGRNTYAEDKTEAKVNLSNEKNSDAGRDLESGWRGHKCSMHSMRLSERAFRL